MRTFILLLLFGGAVCRADVSRLEALSQIETGNNDRAVGGAGEVSRYQIKPWIWRQYSASEAYANRRISTQVAEQHLAELTRIFRKRTRREPTDFDLYVLWNAGPTYYARIGFAKSRVHPVIRERARRYANLREALDERLAEAARAKVLAAASPAKTEPMPAAPTSTLASLSPIPPSVEISSAQKPAFWLQPVPTPSEAPSPLQPSVFAIGGIPGK
jgi:hypothetical protein